MKEKKRQYSPSGAGRGKEPRKNSYVFEVCCRLVYSVTNRKAKTGCKWTVSGGLRESAGALSPQGLPVLEPEDVLFEKFSCLER